MDAQYYVIINMDIALSRRSLPWNVAFKFIKAQCMVKHAYYDVANMWAIDTTCKSMIIYNKSKSMIIYNNIYAWTKFTLCLISQY